MRYIADDGKIFNTEHECTSHEQKLKKEADQRDIDYARLKKKQNKYREALKDFCDEADAFREKYQDERSIEFEGMKSIFDWFFE